MILRVALPNGRVSLYRTDRDINPVGYRVLVPLKEGATTGVVVGIGVNPPSDAPEVIDFPDEEPVIKDYALEVVKELAPYYLITPYRLLFKLLPSQFLWKRESYVIPAGSSIEGLDSLSRSAVEYVSSRKKVRKATFLKKFSEGVLNLLVKKGFLKLSDEWKIPKVSSRVFRLNLPLEEALKRVRSEEKRRLILFVFTSLGVSEEELKERGFKLSHASQLVKSGILSEGLDYAYALKPVRKLKQKTERSLKLSNYELAEGELDFLIEKISERVDNNLNEGCSTLILFPELKHLLYLREVLSAEFGDRVLEVHSSTKGKRLFESWFFAQRSPSVVLGTFISALLPAKNLRDIILFDEASKSVRLGYVYGLDLRNLTYSISKRTRSRLLFLSPVASVQSSYLVSAGLFRKHSSFGRKPVKVLKREPSEILTPYLVDFIEENPDREILFLARKRGYSYMFCHRCELITECPACSTLLTYSMFRELLYCSKCGFKSKELACPRCMGRLKPVGFGIERVIKVIEESFGLRDNFFFSNTPDITDSKDVVVVVSADNILSVPSYYSDEEFFQYLMRSYLNAGKELVVQTVFPEHEAVRSVRNAEPELFLRRELLRREEEKLPPFYRLFKAISSRNMENVLKDRLTPHVQTIFRDRRWHHLLRIEKGNKEAIKRLSELLKEYRNTLEIKPEIP